MLRLIRAAWILEIEVTWYAGAYLRICACYKTALQSFTTDLEHHSPVEKDLQTLASILL